MIAECPSCGEPKPRDPATWRCLCCADPIASERAFALLVPQALAFVWPAEYRDAR